MANTSLNDYVRTQLQRGYTPEAVRTALLQAGYNPQDIDFALRTATMQPKKMIIGGRTLIFILVGILAIVLLIIAGFIIFRGETKELQMSVRIEQPNLFPGDTLSITSSFASQQKKSVPVTLDYVVSEKFTRKAITTRTNKINIALSAIDTQKIPLPPNIAPGDYEVRLTARFESISRVQNAGFTIQQPIIEEPEIIEEITEEPSIIETPEEELPCPTTCDDLNPATEDICERGSCVHITKTNFCGNGECEEGENKILCPEDCGTAQDKKAVTQQAVQTVKSNVESAATLCNSLILPQDSDPCFAAIANASKKSALCTNIKDSRASDNCLWEFVANNDFSVCNQLSNRYLLTSCQSLARFSTIPEEQKEIEQSIQEMETE